MFGVCLILVTLALKPHFKFLNPWAPTKYEFNQLISGFWRNIHFSCFVMASSSWLIRFEIVSHWESYSCRVSRSIYKRLPWHYSDVMSNWLLKIHGSIWWLSTDISQHWQKLPRKRFLLVVERIIHKVFYIGKRQQYRSNNGKDLFDPRTSNFFIW